MRFSHCTGTHGRLVLDGFVPLCHFSGTDYAVFFGLSRRKGKRTTFMIRAFAVILFTWISLAMTAASQESTGSPTPRAAQSGRGAKGSSPKAETAQQQVGKPIPPLQELIKELESNLSGATLVGVFTVDGLKSDRPPRQDKYTLGKVSKLPEADLWRFEAKVALGGPDKTIPIVVAIKWAGDTPMIQLTNTTIPGMGTFSARVFFYEDRYAGTWRHGPITGHMYGRIDKSPPPSGHGDKSGGK
jgi:hypothetical protein